MLASATLAVYALAVLVGATDGPAAGTTDEGVMGSGVTTSGMSALEEIRLVAGQSVLVPVPERVEKVVVVDSDIADAEPVDADEVLLMARAPGITDVVFRLESGRTIGRRLVVGFDESGLESRLWELLGVRVAVEEVGGMVTVRGRIPDVRAAELLSNFMTNLQVPWADLTTIPGVQQVQLRVRIAEASRQALRELAFGGVVGGDSLFAGVQSPGTSTPFQRTGIAPIAGSPVGDAGFSFVGNPVSSTTTLFAGVPAANLEVFLQALDENRYVRLLAEPNLVAASGEEATFLVGGEFPIPVVQGNDIAGGNSVTIEYKEFGVRLVFRPEVIGDGRIRLEVAPEVSELSELGALNQNGFTIPSVVTRRSSTTVELGSGQSFAMAGLLRSTEEARVSRVPVLGDLPVLGVLFRSVRYEEEQTELLVIVTADLVDPMDDARDRPVPGDLQVRPTDWELFMEGRTSGKIEFGSPLARLRALGLEGLRGPGAWRRPDEPRVAAADAMPTVPDEAAQMDPGADGEPGEDD